MQVSGAVETRREAEEKDWRSEYVDNVQHGPTGPKQPDGPNHHGSSAAHSRDSTEWLPEGLGLAIGVCVEVLMLLVRRLSFGRLAVSIIVIAIGTWAIRVVVLGRFRFRPTTGRALLGAALALQIAVVIGDRSGITWWFPLVPALLACWIPFGRIETPPSRPRRLTLLVAVAVVAGTGPAFSLGVALVPRSADSVSIRTVEWLRLRGGQRIVNGIEHWWYTHNAPPTGGAPEIPISVASAVDLPAGKSKTATATKLIAVRPLVSDPVAGEGQWVAMSGSTAHPAIAVTRVRPDLVHTSVVVGLVRMDPALVRLRLFAGTEDPGGTWPEHGEVPPSDLSQLLAVFNSGFRQREAKGGFWMAGREAVPLVSGAASLVVRTDGTATVAQWGRDARLGPDVAAVRQNLSLIVDNSKTVAGLDQDTNRKWGATLGHRVFVWRSGIGVTEDGALIYVGGPAMSIKTLADVLVAAGAVRGMELDINSAWVAYFLFQQTPSGPVGTKLLPGMRHQPTRYLKAQSRDFFAVLSR